MWRAILLVGLMGGAAWGQTTRPATAPATQPTVALAAARQACLDSLTQTPAFQAAVAEYDRAAAAYEQSRRGGTPQARIDASSVMNRAKLVVEKMRADAIKNDPAVADAERAVAQASQRAADEAELARRTRADADAKDPMKIAVREKRLAVGMTLEQARTVMGGNGSLVRESDGEQTYEWRHYQQTYRGATAAGPIPGPRVLIGITYADFEGDKLVEFGKY